MTVGEEKSKTTKTMLAEEIKRSQPYVKVNWKNNDTEKLWTLLRSLPLSQAHKIFVELKESEF